MWELVSDVAAGAAIASVFQRRLLEATLWCDARFDPAEPASSLRRLSSNVFPEDQVTSERVREVCVERARRLGSGLPRTRRTGDVLLSVLYPEGSLSDGAAQMETNGYFDVHNAPPCDTWVALFERAAGTNKGNGGLALISYIPTILGPSTARGIRVNPEECIVWLQDDDSRAEFGIDPELWEHVDPPRFY